LVESFQPWTRIYLRCDPTVNGFSPKGDNGFITFLGVKMPLSIEQFKTAPLVCHISSRQVIAGIAFIA
jgi:hypothetical protein